MLPFSGHPPGHQALDHVGNLKNQSCVVECRLNFTYVTLNSIVDILPVRVVVIITIIVNTGIRVITLCAASRFQPCAATYDICLLRSYKRAIGDRVVGTQIRNLLLYVAITLAATAHF